MTAQVEALRQQLSHCPKSKARPVAEKAISLLQTFMHSKAADSAYESLTNENSSEDSTLEDDEPTIGQDGNDEQPTLQLTEGKSMSEKRKRRVRLVDKDGALQLGPKAKRSKTPAHYINPRQSEESDKSLKTEYGESIPSINNLSDARASVLSTASILESPMKMPVGLENKKELCYSNVIIQALASVLDPDELVKDLGKAHLGPQSTPDFYIQHRKPTVDQKFANFSKEEFNPAHDLVDLIQSMNVPEMEDITIIRPYYFQGSLAKHIGSVWNGDTQEDAADYLRHVVRMLAAGHTFRSDFHHVHPLMDALFRVQTRYSLTCRNDECSASQLKWDITDRDWLLKVDAPTHHLPDNDNEFDRYTVDELLAKLRKPYIVPGHGCNENCGSALGVTRRLEGLEDPPQVLVLQFCRVGVISTESDGTTTPGKAMYGVEFDSAISSSPLKLSRGMRYELRAVIKHKGEDMNAGHYTAYIKGKDDWWWCDDESVAKARVLDVNNPDKCGQAYLAFYVRKT